MRKTEFANDEYYHIYNRGVDKREIFCEKKDYLRFLNNAREFNNELMREQRIYVKDKMLKKNSKTEFNSEASELNSVLEFFLSILSLT